MRCEGRSEMRESGNVSRRKSRVRPSLSVPRGCWWLWSHQRGPCSESRAGKGRGKHLVLCVLVEGLQAASSHQPPN